MKIGGENITSLSCLFEKLNYFYQSALVAIFECELRKERDWLLFASKPYSTYRNEYSPTKLSFIPFL